MERVLVVVVAIGDQYFKRYSELFYENHRAWTDLNGYDLHIVREPIEPRGAHPSLMCMQRYLVCSAPWSAGYDRIVYVDADILFNLDRAGRIELDAPDPTKVWAVDEYTQPTLEKRIEFQRRMRWETSARDYYGLAGFNIETESMINGGLLVMSPRYHREFFEELYEFGIKTGVDHPRGYHYEQSLTGYELQKRGLWARLPNEWNSIWIVNSHWQPGVSIDSFFGDVKGVHFAAGVGMDLIPGLMQRCAVLRKTQ